MVLIIDPMMYFGGESNVNGGIGAVGIGARAS
jgi:hypothetical protein